MRPLLLALLLTLTLAGCTASNATVEPTPAASATGGLPSGSGALATTTPLPTPTPGAKLQVELASAAPWSKPNESFTKATSFYVWGATTTMELRASQFLVVLADGTTIPAATGKATPVSTRTDGWGDVYVEGDSALPRDLPVTVKPGMMLRVEVEFVAPDATPEPTALAWTEGATTLRFPVTDPRVEDDEQIGNGY